jgi:hypothetical protein
MEFAIVSILSRYYICHSRWRLILLGVCLALTTVLGGRGPATIQARGLDQVVSGSTVSGLHVAGNELTNAAGQMLQLHGVNRSGTEYACIQGWGIFDGPSDLASISAMASWHVNAVRIPLNEDCWLGINGALAAYSGSNYQSAIRGYVGTLEQAGLYPILDLHWNAPGSAQAMGLEPMPDEDHSPAFWESVANAFRGDGAVIFDLFNEPYPDSNQDTTTAWVCWRDGGSCPGVPYAAAGMQELVNAVRSTGATNLILVSGIQYANALDQWLAYRPADPLNNLAAAWHNYASGICNTPNCWNSTAGAVLMQSPLVATEIGQNDCAHGYIDPLMDWLDGEGAGYLAWAWNPYDCASFPSLITDYDGTPTAYGAGYEAHLATFAPLPLLAAGPSSAPPAPAASGLPPATASASPAPAGDQTATRDAFHGPLPYATAQCNDGWFSYSQQQAGTCDGHRGVMTWIVQPGTACQVEASRDQAAGIPDTDPRCSSVARAAPAPGAGAATGGGPSQAAITSAAVAAGPTVPAAPLPLPSQPPTFSQADIGVWHNISPAGVSTDSNNPPNNFGFLAIAVDPFHPGVVYVGTSGQGLWRSTDAGDTWSRVDTPANGIKLDGRIWSLSADPFTPGVLYAANGYGSTKGVLKSTDGGVTWNQTLPAGIVQTTTDDIYHIDLDPSQPGHLIASFHNGWNGTGDSGVVETKDGGLTWTIHPPQPNWGHENGVYFLGDSNTWLYITTNDGMWKTPDGGTTWRQVGGFGIGPGGDSVYHASNGAWYTGSVSGLLRSADGGESWTVVATGGGYSAVIGDGMILYSQPDQGGLNPQSNPYMTSPEGDGTRWVPMNSQTFADGPFAMAYDPVSRVIYSANWDAGVWRLAVSAGLAPGG